MLSYSALIQHVLHVSVLRVKYQLFWLQVNKCISFHVLLINFIIAWTGIYFELDGQVFVNNSVLSLSKVGEEGNALLCKTDLIECCGTVPNRYGQFYYPNGVMVPVKSRAHGFYRDRGDQVVRLNRREQIISPKGTFRCEIPDKNGIMQNLYITLR